MNKVGTQTIETRRLVIRRFRVEDAEEMYQGWASDPEVTRYLTWPPHGSMEITRQLLESWIRGYEDGGCFNWAIEWKESGRVIGSIAVVRLYEEREEAEIGYCLSRSFWGMGIMPEALRAVIDFLFDVAGMQRIVACHDVQNPNSGRVMAKAGMRLEGIHRGAGRNNCGVCDEAWYAVLREDRSPRQKREKAEVTIRLAREEDLERVCALNEQVQALHVAGKPEVFRPGDPEVRTAFMRAVLHDPEQVIAVAEVEGEVRGYAVLHAFRRPENPFMHERRFMDVDEFGVDEAYRRRGIGSALIRFAKDYAREKGFDRLELNMWSFNREALAFYEAEGFTTYRRFMEIRM